MRVATARILILAAAAVGTLLLIAFVTHLVHVETTEHGAEDSLLQRYWERGSQSEKVASGKCPRHCSHDDTNRHLSPDADDRDDSSSATRLVVSTEGSILNSPFGDLLTNYFNGTRSFSHVCAVHTARRIELRAMTPAERAALTAARRGESSSTSPSDGGSPLLTKTFAFYSGDTFMTRDVCALGHFPKELTHLFAHVWTAVVQAANDKALRRELLDAYDVLFQKRDRSNSGAADDSAGENDNTNSNNNTTSVDDLERLYRVLARRLLPHVIIGNQCVTKTAPSASKAFAAAAHKGNKYTGVFHKVMVHWVRAIMFPWLSPLQQSEIPDYKSIIAATGTSSAIKGSGEESPLEAFPLGRGGRVPLSGALREAVSFYEDFAPTVSPGKVTCFERVLEREERWRWFPNFEVAHRFRLLLWRYYSPLKAWQAKRIHKLLSVPFPRHEKPRVIVLRRDEDRHFNEKQTAAFLIEKFSSVADVKLVQYDASPGYTPPSYYAQMLELAKADVVIAAHGAALSSMMVMRPGAVLIELFPHNFRYYMYEELAKLMNIEYVAYEADHVSPAGCCSGRNWAGGGGGSSPNGPDTSLDGGDGGSSVDDEADSLSAYDAGAGGRGDVGNASDARFQSHGHGYVQMSRSERFKLIGRIYELHGSRKCKKCDVDVPKAMWYHLMKNALASVWLANSRLSNLHDFDVRA